MREIKFRQAHFTPSGKLILITEWGMLDRGMFVSPHTVSSEDASKTVHMQFTGLKDKNGVEIYEGDISKDWEDIDTYKVVWNKKYACFELERLTHVNDTEEEISDSQFNLEIIGNIYENPELLT